MNLPWVPTAFPFAFTLNTGPSQGVVIMPSEETVSRPSAHSHCLVQRVPAKEISVSQIKNQTTTVIWLGSSENQDRAAAPKYSPDTVVKVPSRRK
ncbi:hypothetical protein M407DRAFT_17652 [Tulasnella calospora MUT 4182]|uniref:Uncharacterized protein n=1 Tax=Tulasnella calospora MUT 4182 TaxID=1051891 RepID=A0A0C3QL56_9AGAM|nr:hypothetical protein M407DRAFT_17652 [Tulasnella calospora MUT 4182]